MRILVLGLLTTTLHSGTAFAQATPSPAPVAATSANVELDTLTKSIQASPNDGKLYSKRAHVYHKLGNPQAALADLKKNCELTADADIKELCDMEVADYSKTLPVTPAGH